MVSQDSVTDWGDVKKRLPVPFLEFHRPYLYIIPVHVPVEDSMARETTYTSARAHLSTLCDSVAESREPVIIRRRGRSAVALIAADELESLTETAHLLRSPKNAERLLKALLRARGRSVKPRSVASLRRELGLEPTS